MLHGGRTQNTYGKTKATLEIKVRTLQMKKRSQITSKYRIVRKKKEEKKEENKRKKSQRAENNDDELWVDRCKKKKSS